MSPHLQIWRWHWTMAASIAQRASGIGNALGLTLVGAWIVALALGGAESLPGGATGVLFWAVIWLFATSVTFHLMNGVRYLVWDSGRGFDPDMASRISVILFAVAALVSAGLLALFLFWAGVF